MATNDKPGKGRKGSVKGRSQFQHATTKLWQKRKTATGRITDVKTTGGKFKGVRRES